MIAMSNAAVQCADNYAGSRTVMAKADSFEFEQPLPIDRDVRIDAKVVFKGWASMTVIVEMTPDMADCPPSVSGRFMMVAVDDNRRPAHLPDAEKADELT